MKLKYERSEGNLRFITRCKYTSYILPISRNKPYIGGFFCKNKCKFHISNDKVIQIVNCAYNDVKLDEDLFKI
jgi:hypothetical protein